MSISKCLREDKFTLDSFVQAKNFPPVTPSVTRRQVLDLLEESHIHFEVITAYLQFICARGNEVNPTQRKLRPVCGPWKFCCWCVVECKSNLLQLLYSSPTLAYVCPLLIFFVCSALVERNWMKPLKKICLERLGPHTPWPPLLHCCCRQK